ncbi:MAG TPA: EAL domain-containing protein [Alphaproteobacteria bacterium]
MAVINHALIVLSYALVAAGAALSLPRQFDGLDPQLAAELAGIFLLVCGLIHFALSRVAHDRAVAAELAAMQDAYAQTRSELAAAREEARRIHEAIAASQGRNGGSPDLAEIMSEVRMLQGLVAQLSKGERAVPHATPAKARTPADAFAAREPAIEAPRVAADLGEGEVLAIVRDGLRSNRVDLFVQPIVSLPQRKHRHYECFSRIRAADGTMITPEQYLGVAEREGLIGAIDNMLLFRSIQLVRRMQKREGFGLFINVSEHTLADADFMREFVAFVAANRDFAPRLVFEFTQASVARHGREVVHELEGLAQLGCRFSMDQVTNLDIDIDELGARHFRFVKVDAARLLEETRSPSRRLDMRTFKRALDVNAIDLVVEKIETEPMVVELLDLPIDLGQGFLFGEPRLARSRESAAA